MREKIIAHDGFGLNQIGRKNLPSKLAKRYKNVDSKRIDLKNKIKYFTKSLQMFYVLEQSHIPVEANHLRCYSEKKEQQEV